VPGSQPGPARLPDEAWLDDPVKAVDDAAESPEAEDADTVEHHEWVLQADAHGQRLDRVLADRITAFSRSHLQLLIEQGHVQIAGRPCTQASKRVTAGQTIAIALVPTAQTLAFRPQPMVLPIVYEDEHLLVINKPAGWVVHPGAGNWSGTLLNGLLAHHAGAAQLPRAGIVHRLDKGTTGLMVVAKTGPAVTALVRAIAAREVRREYLALCHGRLPAVALCLEGPIGRDPRVRTKMAVLGGGKPARTDVLDLACDGTHTAVHCRLHTGRTHQIRVHLSHAGLPLVGDTLYGGREWLQMARPALHAFRLAFAHPVDGRHQAFEAPLPEDLGLAWKEVGAPWPVPTWLSSPV
jgi:23S rRNA pseudouridine1911/1915/1917 synthase